MQQVDRFTPRNARHGRQASEEERQMLVDVYGLPDHALADNIVLKQCGENAKPENQGKWFWTWGDAFFGFHARMNKATNQARFKSLKLKPFPNETTYDGQLGYDLYNYWTSKQNAPPIPTTPRLGAPKFTVVNKYLTPKSTFQAAAVDEEWIENDEMDPAALETEDIAPPQKKRPNGSA